MKLIVRVTVWIRIVTQVTRCNHQWKKVKCAKSYYMVTMPIPAKTVSNCFAALHQIVSFIYQHLHIVQLIFFYLQT